MLRAKCGCDHVPPELIERVRAMVSRPRP
jgi:hypothetical protein